MTAFVFAIQGVGALRPGFDASAWTNGKAANPHADVLTGTC